MKTKRFTALLIAVLMVLQMFVIGTSAAYLEQQDDPEDICFTVPWAETEWNADGVISEGEYTQMDVKTSQLSIAAASDEVADVAIEIPVTLHMSYDTEYVYVAATTSADNYICDIDDSNEVDMWAAHAVQLSLADITATDDSGRLEVGYALSSLDNETYSVNWNDPMGISYDADDNDDYIVVRNGNELIYEMRVPYEAFVETKLKEGDSFLGSIVWAVGTSENGGSDAYTHIQLGYGITGDPGKDPTGHATFTLGDAPEGTYPDEPETVIPDLKSIPYVEADEITIDGEKDAAYDDAAVALIDKPFNGADSGASAAAYLMTNNGLLYLYIDVTDPAIIEPTDEVHECAPWNSDSVEFLFQTQNESFDDVHQFRVDVVDYLSYYRNAGGDKQAYGTDAEAYFEGHKVCITESGYAIEFCVDTKKYGVSAGETIGIQLQLNDMTVDGGVCYHYCATDHSFTVENFDSVLIGVDEDYTTTREIQTEGQCGENLTWKLDDNGVLTVSGTGEMYWDPFGEIRSRIKSVVIENGVTSVSGYAFNECTSLTSVTLGADVAVIGVSAFRSCTSLEQITIPGTVEKIDIWAFVECTALETVVLENGISVIADCAFRDNPVLKTIVIPESVTEIGLLAFYNCSKLESVTLDNCDPVIGEEAFLECVSLKSVDLGNALTSIGNGMFRSCGALTEISLPDSLQTIGDSAFEGCSSLEYVVFGTALTDISGTKIFNDCISLSVIYFRGNAPTAIADEAFMGTSSDLRLAWFDGADGWTSPYWTGPDGQEYKTMCLAAGTEIPIDIPNLSEIPMVDANLISIETIDGEKDEVYNDAAVAVCNKLMAGSTDTGASATASMVGHSGYLFMYIEVTDDEVIQPDPITQANEPWNVDSVEFLLWTNNKLYNDIHQFRLDVTGYPSYYRINNLDGNDGDDVKGDDAAKYFEAFEVVETETGYIIEACIDVRKYGVSYDEIVGIQMQLNDVTEEGTMFYHYFPTDSPFNTDMYDALTIGGWLYSSTRGGKKPEASYRGVVAKTDASAMTVDGKMDEAAWADALQITIGTMILGNSDTGARGFAYMLWADDKWYLYVNVNDDHVEEPIPYMQENEPWRADSVEMFFDFGNKHEHIVEQFRLDCSGYPSYYQEGGMFTAYGDAAKPYFHDYAVTVDDEGYNIEMCLNLDSEKYGLEEGYEIGIQLQLNDMWAEIHPDDNAAVYVMGSALDAHSWEVNYYDYISLGGPIESQIPEDTTDYDAYLNASASAVVPGETVYVDFFIPEGKELETSGFALSNFVYNEEIFAIDVENIEILVDPLIRDITQAGNVVVAFAPAATLGGTVIRVPFTVLDTASGGTYTIACTAQYQAYKATERLLTKQAEIYVDSDKEGKPADSYRGEVVKVDSSAISIDGKMDESVWADALQVSIGKQIDWIGETDTGTRGFAYMLWADEKWYLYVNVYDEHVETPKPELQETEPWRTDSVEMFFDFGNDHSQLVSQFRLDCSGYTSYYVEDDVFHAYGEDAKQYFDDYAVTIDEDGYNIEMCLNMAPYGLDIGDEIGIQLQINDMNNDYSEDDLAAIYVLDSAQGADSWEVEKYDYIRLGGEADHTANAIEGGALVADLAAGEAGDTVVLDFVISAEDFATTGFALANFKYSTQAFTMLTDEITLSDGINPLIADISANGNIVMAFDSATQLQNVIVSIPFTVNENAPAGDYKFSCTAQYQGNKSICNMLVASASVAVQSDVLNGDVNGDGYITTEDAILLLWYVFLPESHEIAAASVDYNGDGAVSSADAVYLLWHVFTPDGYPLY